MGFSSKYSQEATWVSLVHKGYLQSLQRKMGMQHFFQLYGLLCILHNIESARTDVFQISREDNLVFKTMGIIQQCFGENSKTTLLIGNWTMGKNLYYDSHIFSYTSTSYILMQLEESDIFLTNKRPHLRLTMKDLEIINYPLMSVNIILSSTSTLLSVLENLRKSRWWNHEALFLIINENLDIGCGLASNVLTLIWSFKILSAIYVCGYAGSGLRLYSFNPFSDAASSFWNISKDISEQPSEWTLLVHSITESFYSNRTSMCNGMHFDKTKNINLYNLKLGACLDSVGELTIRMVKNKTGFSAFQGSTADLFSLVFTSVNASFAFKIFSDFGFIDTDGKPQGYLSDVMSDKMDIVLNTMLMRNYWNLQTYPLEIHQMLMATSIASEKMRFLKYFSFKIWLYLFAYCTVCILALKYLLKKPLPYILLEFLRMLIQTSTIHVPKSFSGKFRFSFLFLLIFCMGSFIESIITAFQTVPFNPHQIDSISDLLNSNIKIYAGPEYKEMIIQKELKQRFEDSTYGNCISHLLNRKNVVCLPFETEVLELKYHGNGSEIIHISRFPLIVRPVSFTATPDWPLLSKVNKILLKIGEAGLNRLFKEREEHSYYIKQTAKPNTFKKLSEEIVFAFYLLVIGYAVSIIAFIVECRRNLHRFCIQRVPAAFKNIVICSR